MQHFQCETFPLLYGYESGGIQVDCKKGFSPAFTRNGKLHLSKINTIQFDCKTDHPLLSTFRCDGQNCISHTSGLQNKRFCICKLDVQSYSLSGIRFDDIVVWREFECESPILGVESFPLGNNCHQLLKHEKSVSVYNVQTDKMLSINIPDNVISGSINPILSGSGLEEVAVFTSKGTLVFYSQGKQKSSIVLEEGHSWGEVRWSNHPRILLTATQTGLFTLDLRDPKPNFHHFPNQLQYFDVESGSRFLCGFEESLNLYDERFLQRPMLKWNFHSPMRLFAHGGNGESKYLCAVGNYGEINLLPYDPVSFKTSLPSAIPFPIDFQRDMHDSWTSLTTSLSFTAESSPSLMVGTMFGSIFKFELSLQAPQDLPKINNFPEAFHQMKETMPLKWFPPQWKGIPVHPNHFEVPRTLRDIKKFFPKLAKECPDEANFISAVSKKLGVRLVKFGNGCYSSKNVDLGDIIHVDLDNLSFLKPLQNESEEMDLLTQLSQLAEVKDQGKKRETAENLVRNMVSMYET